MMIKNHLPYSYYFISICYCYLVILAVVSIGCYYYYTRDRIKKEHAVSYKYKMNNLRESNIKMYNCFLIA